MPTNTPSLRIFILVKYHLKKFITSSLVSVIKCIQKLTFATWPLPFLYIQIFFKLLDIKQYLKIKTIIKIPILKPRQSSPQSTCFQLPHLNSHFFFGAHRSIFINIMCPFLSNHKCPAPAVIICNISLVNNNIHCSHDFHSCRTLGPKLSKILILNK